MDPTFDVSNKLQDSTVAAKQRFESFKMGGGAPANSLTNHLPKHSHRRSRSRNSSISSLSTLSISASTSTSAPSLTSPELFINTSTNVSSNGPLSKRPTSHHRRRSSVSTRCESAELMGVSLPDLPPSHSEDNINLGDRDSIRRRALWALEGKPDLAFSKVEIPDITSPDLTMPCESSTKPSFPTGPNGHGLNNLMSKRDSFGKLFGLSSTSKDQLHTLVEEEEEEDESQEERSGTVTKVIEELEEAPLIELAAPASTVTTKPPSRNRPVSLNLKPLSLVSAVTCNSGNLPTPTLTPAPRHNGLRSLALASGSDAATDISASSTIRHSATTAPSSTGSFSRRSSSFSSESSCDLSRKRSSISYKRSVVSVPRNMGALPSPDATPINRHFPDLSDVGSIPDHPLSATEQHFLFKSHNVLLTRIIDLERTLRSRSMSQSRPLSIASDISATTSEPSDEMLQLISDLKAERDELKRDVDGWRMRVADADKQATVLARRVESERREAWVARSRVGLLEVEKKTLERAISTKSAELEQSITQSEQSKKERDDMKEELDRLRARLRDADNAVDECIRLRAALEQERTRRAELENLLDNAGLLNTPTIPHPIDGRASRSFGTRPRGLGFQSVQSIESDGSTTDVESVDHSFTKAELTLDVVTEEDEDTCDFYDEEDELAGYEDEDESDLSFQSPGGSSIGSEDEVDFGPVSVLNEATTQLNSLSKLAASTHSHSPRASLSKTWTFPRGQSGAPVKVKHDDDEIDRFFGCLDDDVEDSSSLGFDMAKAMFTSSFGSANEDEDEEELPPFLIPSDVGTIVSELPTSRSLGVVREEDEVDEGEADDEDDGEFLGEEVEGGIRFTFGPPTSCVNPLPPICISPPPTICITPPIECESVSLARKQIPVLEPFDDEEDESALFTLPQVRVQEPITSPSSWPLTAESSSHPSSRIINPPSSIPRATSLRSFVPTTPPTPPSEVSGRFAATPSYPATSFITPPSRRGGTTPSFIPQPVSPSPSKIYTSRKCRIPALRSKAATNVKDDATPRCYGTSEKITVARSNPDTSDICEYPVPEPQAPTSSFSSIMSSPLAARFSFQTLSNFIPLSWSPGAAAVASHTSPSMSDDDNAAEAASLFASVCPGERRSAERKFVSRDRQLEKLRNRLGDDHKGIGHCLAVNACGSCKGANIFL